MEEEQKENEKKHEKEDHNEIETKTIILQILRTTNQEIVEEHEKTFETPQKLEQAKSTLSVVGNDYFMNLMHETIPNTTFPSVIYNYSKFPNRYSNQFFTEYQIISNRLTKMKLFLRLIGHNLPIQCVSIDDDSKLFITGAQDGNVKIWHLPSLTAMATLKGHTDTVTQAEISPDRRLLCTISDDQFIRLWSLEDFSAVYALKCEHKITSFSFSPFNDLILFSLNTDLVFLLKICDLPPEIQKIDGLKKNIDSFINSANDFKYMEYPKYCPSQFLRGYDRIIWKHKYMNSSIISTKFSPGGYLFAYGFENGYIIVRTIDNKHVWKWIPHDNRPVDGIYFLKTKPLNLITWTQKANSVKLWDLNNIDVESVRQYKLKLSRGKHTFIDLALSSDESFLFAAFNSSVFIYQIDLDEPILTFDIKDMISISPHPSIPTICALSAKTNITVINISNEGDKILNTLEIPIEMPKIHFSVWHPNGLMLFAIDDSRGIYAFRVTENPPQCEQEFFFFPTDFAETIWVPSKGQVDKKSEKLIQDLPKNILLDPQEKLITDKYVPYLPEHVKTNHIILPETVHIRIAELKLSSLNPETKIKINQEKQAMQPVKHRKDLSEADSSESDLQIRRIQYERQKKAHRKGHKIKSSDQDYEEDFSSDDY